MIKDITFDAQTTNNSMMTNTVNKNVKEILNKSNQNVFRYLVIDNIKS